MRRRCGPTSRTPGGGSRRRAAGSASASSPQTVALLHRFNRALTLVEQGVDGAEVAYRLGYADQPHFVNEFRRFAGVSPSGFGRARQVQFLQDEGARAA